MNAVLKVVHAEKQEGDFLYVFDHREDDGRVDTIVSRRLLKNGDVDPGYPEERIKDNEVMDQLPFGALTVYYDLKRGSQA